MLFKKDSVHGHVIVDTDSGPIYESDGMPVDNTNPRPCVGCSARIKNGEHDPCIANLPGAYQACCGHGLDRSPVHGNPNGYVAFKDGRSIRFSGLVGGPRIRAAVDAVLAEQPLPEGFEFEETRMWWEGLTEAQRAYVQQNMTRGLSQLVREATQAEPSPKIISGEAMWYEGLNEEQKAHVMNSMQRMLAELVQEALQEA
jgi:hypothetical protein